MVEKKTSVTSGFTLIEVLIVISLLAILFSLGAIVFNSFARKDQLLVEARKIEAILNEARIKTLAGFSLGAEAALNFGVYFQADRYVLFPGLTYDPQNVNNQEFVFHSTLEISPIFLPSNMVIFEKVTGEVIDFNPSQNYLILNDRQSNQKRKISLNQLGVVRVEEF